LKQSNRFFWSPGALSNFRFGAEFGVRVNAVAPGPVETEMLNRVTGSADRKAGLIAGVPLKRAGTPDEIDLAGESLRRTRAKQNQKG
jgi:NAD(P)-dependent dehydrogenase (short-subunit alcohol dehydrogenase family)